MDDACEYCGTFCFAKDVTTGAAVVIRENEGIAATGGTGLDMMCSTTPCVDVCGIDLATVFGADGLAEWISTTSLPFLLVLVVDDVKLMNAIPSFPLVSLVDASLLELVMSFFEEDGPFLDDVLCKGVDRNSLNNEFNSVLSPAPPLPASCSL